MSLKPTVHGKISLRSLSPMLLAGATVLCFLAFQNFGEPSFSAVATVKTPKPTWNRARNMSGSVIRASNCIVQGWALNTDSPDDHLTLQIDVDGQAQATFLADAVDPLVTEALGAPSAHGFSKSLTGCNGSHRIELFVVANSSRQLLQIVTLNNGAL